jgi:hypothetical protein
MQNMAYFVSGILLLSALTACSTPTEKSSNSTPASVEPTPSSSTISQSRPITKNVTDEWTQKPIPVKLFAQEGIPLTTYYPENDFIVESASADEGTGIWFFSKLEGKKYEDAYIHIFLPNNPSTVEAMKKSVTGERGLMKTKQWQVKHQTQNVSLNWAKERIDFEQIKGSKAMMGTVYIGESQGKVFRVTEYFPADYGDGFAPRASIVLKELQLQ